MRKKAIFLAILAPVILFVFSQAGLALSAVKPEVGELLIQSKRTRDGEIITINMNLNVSGPKNSRTKMWIDNGDGKGFQDFGEWIKTNYQGVAGQSLTLDCNSYSGLEPGKLLRIGERALVQKIYAEYISGEGVGKVSPTVWHVKDCRTNPEDYKEATGNSLFPYTLESILDTKFWVKPYPTSTEQPASLKFIGRYYDGPYSGRQATSNTLKYPFGDWGTMSHGSVQSTADRIYLNTGSAVESYDKNIFLFRMANEPLAVFIGTFYSKIKDNISGGQGYRQALLAWKAYFNVLDPAKGQIIPPNDSGFAHTLVYVDDRGYLYLSGEIGNIIVRDAGASLEPVSAFTRAGLSISKNFPGTISPPFKQDPKLPDYWYMEPGSSVFYKGNKTMFTEYYTGNAVGGIKTGGKYYLVTKGSAMIGSCGSACNRTFTSIFDVSDVMNPRSVRLIAPNGEDEFRGNPDRVGLPASKFAQAGEVLAVTENYGTEIKIYSAADYVNGVAAKKVFAAGDERQYMSLTADEASGKFFSFYKGPKATISVFSPGASGGADSYTETRYELSGNISKVYDLDYEGGYLLASRISPTSATDAIKIWSFKSGQPQELATGGFFRKYYNSRDSDAGPLNMGDSSIHTIGGKSYLFVGGSYLGDVYELEPAASAPLVEVCGNNIDDDGDGQVDEGCPTTTTEICGNGIDDDKDGLIDEGCGIQTTVGDTGCLPGYIFSTQTGDPCACVLNPQFPLGTKSEAVKTFQQMLKGLGFLLGKVDGSYGPITRAADLAYCKSVKYPTYKITPPAPPTPPVVSAVEGPRTLSVNQVGIWTAKATDPNNDDLYWSVDWGQGRSLQTCPVNPPTGTGKGATYTASHSWVQEGTYTVTFYSSDCNRGTGTSAITVTVSGTAQSPQIAPQPQYSY